MKDAAKTLQKLVADWQKTDDDTKLQEFFLTDDYIALPYLVRNRGFITGSKIHSFHKDQITFKYQYVDEVPSPYALDTTNEALAIGGAFDHLRTHGKESFDRHYVVVPSRVGSIDEEIALQEDRIAKAKITLNKDGTRSKPSLEAEEKAVAKIAWLGSIRGKTQLTESNWDMVCQIDREFCANALFNSKPAKKIVVARIGKIPLKCELDDYQEHFTSQACRADDFHVIKDMKTCANIAQVDPANYVEQLALYRLMLTEWTFRGEPTWDGRPIGGIIEAVDKHGLWSRSRGYYFSPERLEDAKATVMQKILACWDGMRTGIFVPPRETNFDSPYWGWEGYGRENSFIIV